MEKKLLIIVCFVMLIGGYFYYNYQGEQRAKGRIEKDEAAEKNHQDSMAIIETYRPLSSLLEKEIAEFIADAKKKEPENETARMLYFLTIGQDKDGEYIQLNTGYGFDKKKIKGFTRFNGDIIIYYGNQANVEQELIDESMLITLFDQIEYYADQKPEKETKSRIKRYTILDRDSIVSFKE